MESPIGFVLTLFFASSLLVFLPSSSPVSAANLVDDVCKNTINNAECLKLLGSDPRARSASNYKVLAQVALELAIANAKDSQAFINNLLKSDPRDSIKECASWYKAAADSFRSAKEEIEEDPMSADYDAKIAGDDAGNCETALSSKGVKVPEISNRNHVVQLYSNIADVIIDHLD